MISKTAVKEKIDALSRDEVSLTDFERWLADYSIDMHRQSDDESTTDFISLIHTMFSERDDLVLSSEQLREQLLALNYEQLAIMITVRIDVDRISPATFPQSSAQVKEFPEVWIPLPV